MHRCKTLVLSTLLLFSSTSGLAGIASKMIQNGIVFHVTPSGEPEIVGQLYTDDPIDIIGYLPDFNWVRIRFENDDGYVLREVIDDPGLKKEYFDPKADHLGRRSSSGTNYEAALTQSLNKRNYEFSVTATGAMNSMTKFGFGGSLNYGAFSWGKSGYQVGLDGLFYFGTVGTPFISTLYARYWTPGQQKLGIELFSSLNFLTIDTDQGIQRELSYSYGLGATYALPLYRKIILAPGARVNLVKEWGISALLNIQLLP